MRSTATNLGGFVADEQVEPIAKNSNSSMTQTIITPAKPNSRLAVRPAAQIET
jgi:hypothetical protein